MRPLYIFPITLHPRIPECAPAPAREASEGLESRCEHRAVRRGRERDVRGGGSREAGAQRRGARALMVVVFFRASV